MINFFDIMMKKGILWIAAAVVAIAASLGSCGTQKDTTKGGGAKLPEALGQRFENTVASYGEWTTLKTQGKVTLGGSSPFSSAMQITMVRGKSVNVSLRPLLGIEMGRIYITGDSVVIVNKVEKYYIAESLSLLTGGVPLNINDMQDLLLARMFELGNGTITPRAATLKSVTNGEAGLMDVTLQPKGMNFAYTFAVDSDLALRTLTLEAGGKPVDLSANYSNHFDTPCGKVAGNVRVESKLGGKDMSIEFKFDRNILWNQSINDRSPIDSRYRRVEAEALLKGMFK